MSEVVYEHHCQHAHTYVTVHYFPPETKPNSFMIRCVECFRVTSEREAWDEYQKALDVFDRAKIEKVIARGKADEARKRWNQTYNNESF